MIQILSIGKTPTEYAALISHWLKMIKFSICEKVLIAPKGLRDEQLKKAEAKMLRQYITKPGVLVTMDVTGTSMTSAKFAQIMLHNIENSKAITFVIGGAYGLDQELLREADLVLSLSPMTMPHLLAKLVLIEQIYRAETIITGHPYHK